MTDPADAARSYLLAEHELLLRTVCECAEAVAAGWTDSIDAPSGMPGGSLPATRDSDAVGPPLEAALDRAGATADLASALAGAVDAAGYGLQTRPVPGPPYVVVTSVGPVLRATVADGRLVIRLRVFGIDRRDGVWYVHRSGRPADVLEATFEPIRGNR